MENESKWAAWWDARLSPSPDLGSPRRLALTALAVGLIACAMVIKNQTLHRGMGDTDDALRLVMVRDLLAGQGWYDEAVRRLAPPAGAYMHWSRLLDGALAGIMSLTRVFVGPATAEWATRMFWPLAWIPVAVACALAVARNLGGRSAVLLAAVLLLMDLQLYRQFIPGRIDHHNIQIVMTLLALACATDRGEPGRRTLWAAVGGVAAGLGLAIGLEALAFQAVIGAAHGVELARDPRGAAKPALAYGLALAGSSLAFFLIQTPPWRWSMPFCDALAVNLAAALAVAGLGLGLAGALAERLSARGRIILLIATAAAAGAVYLALDPACARGPFADMDPRVRPFWFDRIQEVQTLASMLRIARFEATMAAVVIVLTCAAALYLAAREWPRPRTASLAAAVLMGVATVTAYLTWRMMDYVGWIGTPVLAAAFSRLGERWLRDKMAPTVAMALVFSPSLLSMAVNAAATTAAPPGRKPADPGARCFAPAAFVPLAKLPRGLVVATPDLGSYILDATPHSVVVAPYHRLSKRILAVHEAFNAPPPLAEARFRALGADYVVDCPGYPMFLDAGSFGMRLRAAPPPPWLVRLSAPKAALSIYGLRPARTKAGAIQF